MLGLDRALVRVREADRVDVGCEHLVEVGPIRAVVLDRNYVGRRCAQRADEALVIGADELREVMGSDHVARRARVFEQHGVAGARGEDRVQVALGSLGDALEERFDEVGVADEVHQQRGHAAQLGGHQERRDDHRGDEEVVSRALAQPRQRFEHERHASSRRRIGIDEAVEVGLGFERALDDLRVVVVEFANAATECLGLDRETTPGNHRAVVFEELGR